MSFVRFTRTKTIKDKVEFNEFVICQVCGGSRPYLGKPYLDTCNNCLLRIEASLKQMFTEIKDHNERNGITEK